ncbi:MAG: hypothetical protein J0L94_12105 [Rhodothermia bacterium]|nr:hypothetical protein [Rhodothermia bacterium]
MPPLRGWAARLMTDFYDDATPTGLGFVMAKAESGDRCRKPHAEAWG